MNKYHGVIQPLPIYQTLCRYVIKSSYVLYVIVWILLSTRGVSVKTCRAPFSRINGAANLAKDNGLRKLAFIVMMCA